MRYALVVMTACGSNAAVVCTTTLTGNLDETIESTSACATLRDGALSLEIASTTSGLSLAISIDLGASSSAGTYTPETVASWSAIGNRATADGGECVYAAGSDAVPAGSFTLDLAPSTDAPHGTLELVQFVQAEQDVDCGAGDDEMVAVAF